MPDWPHEIDERLGNVYIILGRDERQARQVEEDTRARLADQAQLGEAARLLAEQAHDGMTISQVIVQEATNLGILPNEGLAAIDAQPLKATQIHPLDIVLSFCLESEGLATGVFQTSEVLTETVFMPEKWSACYQTARRLFTLLREIGGTDIDQAISQTYKARRIAEVKPAGDRKDPSFRSYLMTEAITFLCNDMSLSTVPRIYNCGYGVHGFALLVRNARVELLQSFANGLSYKLPAFTIAQSLKLNKSWAIPECIKLLASMGSQDVDERMAAQHTLFSTSIESESVEYPWCEFYWEGDNLKGLNVLIDCVRAQLLENLAKMKSVLDSIPERVKRIKEAKTHVASLSGK